MGSTSVTLYQWDHRNRLAKVTQQANYGTNSRILTYEYDAFDGRVNSHTISVSTGLATRSTYWVWDGQQLALQLSDGDGAGPNAPSRTYRFLYGPGIDQVFNQEGTATSHWLLGDHLGTTREVVDDSGTLQRHYVFDAYGNLQGSTAHTMILFAGRELDAVSGLYYVRARWYDPAVGRWVSEDPIGFAGGDTNLARYVANSPVNYNDPSGLAAETKPPSEASDDARELERILPHILEQLKKIAKETRDLERFGVILKAKDPKAKPQYKFVECTSKETTEFKSAFKWWGAKKKRGGLMVKPGEDGRANLDRDEVTEDDVDSDYPIEFDWHTHPPKGDPWPSTGDSDHCKENEIVGIMIAY